LDRYKIEFCGNMGSYMGNEMFDVLEERLENLLRDYNSLKQEVLRLREENHGLLEEREGFRDRMDVIIKKLEGI
jgi:regulator of replication initiation timing